MVEDSIMQEFSSSDVSVLGIDIWNTETADIESFLSATGITYPLGINGASTSNSYDIIANSMVVIDQDGLVQFVQQLGTSSVSYSVMKQMVSDAKSTVTDLLSTGIAANAISHFSAIRKSTVRGYSYSLSGRLYSGSGLSACVLATPNGRTNMLKQSVAK